MGFLHSMKKKTKKIGTKAALAVGKIGVSVGKATTLGGKVLQTVGEGSEILYGNDMGLSTIGKGLSQYGKVTQSLGRSTREGVRGNGRAQMNQLEKSGKRSIRFLKTARRFR